MILGRTRTKNHTFVTAAAAIVNSRVIIIIIVEVVDVVD